MITNDLHEPIQILRYMGNKTKIINFIVKRIVNEVPQHGYVLDLMAGTHAISYALKGRYVIYANDIQQYSAVIGKALVENNAYLKVTEEDIVKLLQYMQENLSELESQKSMIKSNQYISSKQDHIINKYKKDSKKFPYCLFSYYFADKYFTLRNCMVIDSLRYAIDKLTKEDKDEFRKSVLLTCLLYAISYTVLTTGHFAQYRVRGEDLKSIKERKVEEYFLNKARSIQIRSNGKLNRIFNENYKFLFERKEYQNVLSKLDLVYLDPPYSGANYSRYYHIPETLVKYDYPGCFFKGCYREDRHNSRFCSKNDAEKEFEYAIKNISQVNNRIKLIVSYSRSNSSILSVSQIRRICRKYFNSIDNTYEVEHLHSSQGKQNGKVKEIVIVCRSPVTIR